MACYLLVLDTQKTSGVLLNADVHWISADVDRNLRIDNLQNTQSSAEHKCINRYYAADESGVACVMRCLGRSSDNCCNHGLGDTQYAIMLRTAGQN
jgi:hypothetical protein